MADRPNSQKAQIVKVSNPSEALECHFNPDTFKLDRTVSWRAETSIGGDVSNITFEGGEAHKIGPIELLFDTTDTGKDVRKSYELLLELAEIDTDKKNPTTDMGEPPLCRFQWGKFLSFTAVITAVNQSFTMFKPDGTPVRAMVSVSFIQVPEKIKGQNPTTRSESRKIWVVQEGQALDWIAYQEYGEAAHWRHIAETNNLANPGRLRPGQVLKLVPLP
jgi:nucleoid-associated protein YgaU